MTKKSISNNGYTLMETLCVIALLLVYTGTLCGLIYVSGYTVSKIGETSKEQFRQLYTENLVRETIENFKIPYWENNHPDKTEVAVIKALEIKKPGINILLTPLKDETGRLRGFNCRWSLNGNTHEIAALFISIPL